MTEILTALLVIHLLGMTITFATMLLATLLSKKSLYKDDIKFVGMSLMLWPYTLFFMFRIIQKECLKSLEREREGL